MSDQKTREVVTVTIKQFPPNIHKWLKARAKRNFRSMNSEFLKIMSDELERDKELYKEMFKDEVSL